MFSHKSPVRAYWPVLVLSLTILSGCAGFGKYRAADDPWVRNAEARLGVGDYQGAAQIFEERAMASGHPDYFRLRAGDAHLRAGNNAATQALLTTVDPSRLDESERVDYYLLAARVNLNVGRSAQAKALLDKIATSPRDRSQELHYRLLQASAYNQLGRMLDSARERVLLGPLLSGSDAIEKNNAAIFDALNRLPDRALDNPGTPVSESLNGWIALTRILRSDARTDVTPLLQQWRQRYPDHPADGVFLENALRDSGRPVGVAQAVSPPPAAERQSETPNANVATPEASFTGVLLPLSGAYSPAGEAIRAGMLAAFYSDSAADKRPLRFVDSQSGGIGPLYKGFVGKGASLIVGPLLKEQVASTLEIPETPVPILALNEIPQSSDRVVQFGLTPEQEVEQAAGAAWFDGHHRALLLAPTSAFGQRLSSHFASYWRSLGGKVIASRTYAPNAVDYAETVQSLASVVVKPAEPGASAAVVERAADFVFLIANAHDGRLIKPQFDAHQLSSLPIYATSHVFSGRADPSQDHDLDGIYFCDIPWLLHTSDTGPLSAMALQAEIDKTAPDFVKLIALGIDAYRLGKDMVPIESFTGQLFDGATGMLTLQSGNRVQRQLECAQFEGGVPQLRGLAPILRPTDPVRS